MRGRSHRTSGRNPLPGLGLGDAEQLRAVEVGKTLPDFCEGETGQFLVQRVMPARLIDDDKTIALALETIY